VGDSIVNLATNEEEMLRNALAMSVDQPPSSGGSYTPHFDAMTEEQQIALAMQMSLADDAMDVEPTPATAGLVTDSLPEQVNDRTLKVISTYIDYVEYHLKV